MNKKSETTDLLIPYEGKLEEAAIRIYDEGKVVFYSSTRIAGVERVKEGYLVKDVDAFIGMKYELKLLDTKKILTGIVNNGNSNSKLD